MKSRWLLPPQDPRRRPHDLLPGEMAIFVFETAEERLPADHLSQLLSVTNVKLFLVSTGGDSPNFFRRRVEVAPPSGAEGMTTAGSSVGGEPQEEGLFPLAPSGAATPAASQGIAQPTQEAMQSVFQLSSFKDIFSQTTFQNFFTPPTMLVWRCGGAPAAHYSEFYHYEPDLPPTPLPPALRSLAVDAGQVLALKTLTSPVLLSCYAAFPPVFTAAHLHHLVSLDAAGAEGFTVLMIGASDCPPCRNVFSNAKVLWDALPQNTTLYKADWYLAKEAREVVDVPAIPYFVIFKNEEILRLPSPAAFDDAGAGPSEKWTPLATMQDSNVNNLIGFIHQHTTTLSFDEDF